jgi:hypothetical protein
LAVDPREQGAEAHHLVFNQRVHGIEKKCPNAGLVTDLICLGRKPIEERKEKAFGFAAAGACGND